MKMTILITLIALSTSIAANTKLNFNIDDVDSISANGKTILIEDIRDNFENISGVTSNDKQVSVSKDSNTLISFKNGNILKVSTHVLIGGDGGGG